MSAAVVESTEVAESLAAHDWAIPCEYRAHERLGGGDTATWAVWFTNTLPCGCPGGHFRYFCDHCWAYRNHMGWVRCVPLDHEFPALANVLRVERITASP